MDDWLRMSAGDLGRGIEAGEIDPVALAEAFLAAMDSDGLTPRIYARTTPERARAEAQAAAERAKLGLRRSPLDGVPVSWKDLFDTAGVGTESGTALLKGRVPDRDAEVLRTATAQGLVCLGKTHQTELAFSGIGLNPVTASPPCVNDADAVSGGSSSGAATSVAFGLAAAAVGSDTGGSVRVPAAWNDLVGLKTTSGRLSLDGVVPLAPRFDTVGPLTRTVEDAALMLAALDGGRPADLAGASLKGVRLLALQTIALDDVRPDVRAGFDAALAGLEAAGATVEPREVPLVADAMALSAVLFDTEAWGTWGAVIENSPEVMFPPVRDRFMGGKVHSGADFVRGWRTLDRLRAEWTATVAGYDAVVLPSCAILPPNMARLQSDAAFFKAENLLTLRNTRIGNLLGGCALSLPTAAPSVGVMFMGAPMAEERLLRLGAAAEAALTEKSQAAA